MFIKIESRESVWGINRRWNDTAETKEEIPIRFGEGDWNGNEFYTAYSGLIIRIVDQPQMVNCLQCNKEFELNPKVTEFFCCVDCENQYSAEREAELDLQAKDYFLDGTIHPIQHFFNKSI